MLFEIPDSFEFPKYSSLINRLQVIGIVIGMKHLTDPLLNAIHDIGVVANNIRLFTSASAYNSNTREKEEYMNCRNTEKDGYKIHTHALGKDVYAYILAPDTISLPDEYKYNSIGIKVSGVIKDNGFYIAEKQDIPYGSLYVAKNSPKCIRINFTPNWTNSDKKYMLKVDKTDEF